MNPGQRIGPFEIASLLGRGGMGEVFLATNTRLDRKVAVKVMTTDLSGITDRLQRFEQQARTLTALDHLNILSIFGIGTHYDAPHLASQLLQGKTLRQEAKNIALTQRQANDDALLACYQKPQTIIEPPGSTAVTIHTHAEDETIGQTLGRYKLLETVGRA